MPFEQYGEAKLSDFGLWDRMRIFFLPTRVYDDHTHWQLVQYKVYKHRRVILNTRRYH